LLPCFSFCSLSSGNGDFSNESGVALIIKESPAHCWQTRTKLEDIAGQFRGRVKYLGSFISRGMRRAPADDIRKGLMSQIGALLGISQAHYNLPGIISHLRKIAWGIC
jgi:hypothetical protein